MCKKLQTINAETLLVKNQDNPEYLDVILNGKETLESAFADIKHPEIIRKMKDAKKNDTKIPRKVILLIRQKETMQKLLYLMAS